MEKKMVTVTEGFGLWVQGMKNMDTTTLLGRRNPFLDLGAQ